MSRLILIALLIAIVAFALVQIRALLTRTKAPARAQPQEDTMPETIAKISYVALIVLMFMVVSGFVGGN